MINKIIRELAEKVLSEKEIEATEELIDGIKGKKRDEVLINLTQVLGSKPKRPLYYIAHAISELPGYGTRNIIRYSGDYIDQLVRFTLEDKRFLSRWFQRPLGPNIKIFKKFIDLEFFETLELFNQVYAQAKHEFNHQEDESFFSVADAVFIIFITKKISQKILPMSELARDYNNQGDTCYSYHILE